MTLQQTLHNIKAKRYYQLCGYSYQSLKRYNHTELSFNQLNPSLQLGIIRLMMALYKGQKMIYAYDIEFTEHYLKDCGIKLSGLYKDAQINKGVYRGLYLGNKRDEKLMAIRYQIIKYLNRIFEYILR